MSPYSVIACVVAIALSELGLAPRLKGGIVGTLIIAIIWPVLIPMGLYYTFKTQVLKRPFRMGWVADLEVFGCVCVTAVGFYFYLLQRMP